MPTWFDELRGCRPLAWQWQELGDWDAILVTVTDPEASTTITVVLKHVDGLRETE